MATTTTTTRLNQSGASSSRDATTLFRCISLSTLGCENLIFQYQNNVGVGPFTGQIRTEMYTETIENKHIHADAEVRMRTVKRSGWAWVGRDLLVWSSKSVKKISSKASLLSCKKKRDFNHFYLFFRQIKLFDSK